MLTTIFIFLSIGGLYVAYILFEAHRKGGSLICYFNHDCSFVTESEWGSIFYVRNETLGLVYFSTMIILGILATFIPAISTPLYLLMFLGSLGAVLVHIFLVAVQAFIIRDYCFYCLLSAAISTLMLIVATLLAF